MQLPEIFQQLRQIEPDPDYTKRSRSFIVQTPLPERPLASPWKVFVHSLQFGSTVALAGVLLILVVTGFSSWKFLSPFGLQSLDPTALRAEADAIEMQIELARIRYAEPEDPGREPGIAAREASAEEAAKDARREAVREAESLGLAPATSSQAITVELILEALAE